MAERFMVWKHDCAHCEPACDDPWQVDTPVGYCWTNIETDNTFATHGEAIAFALAEIADGCPNLLSLSEKDVYRGVQG